MFMTKRVLVSLMIIAIVAGFAGVGTYALYTDSASSTGNQFSAGVLDIKVDGSDNMTVVRFDNMVPGEDGFSWYWKQMLTTNTGSVAGGKLTLRIDDIQDFAGVTPAPEAAIEDPDVGDLSSNVKILVYMWEPPYGPTPRYVGTYAPSELVAGIVLADTFKNGTYLEIDGQIPDAADNNKLMGDYMTFAAHLTLEQAH